MNTRTETELIKYFSWPAYLNIFFYIIKNKNKKWKELKREKSWPDFCYGWTFDFLKLLWVCNSYDRETNMFLLTESGEELYLIIKDIDDWLLFSHSEVNESSIEEYNKELLNNIGSEKLYVIKNILFFLINKSKWFILIKEILENKEYIIKNELYIELAKKLNVAEATIKNRAPSMLQLAIFLNIFLLEEWKIKKNIQYFISEIYEKKEEDKKINELLNEETEEKTADEKKDLTIDEENSKLRKLATEMSEGGQIMARSFVAELNKMAAEDYNDTDENSGSEKVAEEDTDSSVVKIITTLHNRYFGE